MRPADWAWRRPRGAGRRRRAMAATIRIAEEIGHGGLGSIARPPRREAARCRRRGRRPSRVGRGVRCTVPSTRRLRGFRVVWRWHLRGVPNGRKRFGSSTAAAASSFSADRRAAGIPTSMDFAKARRWASGKTWVNRGWTQEVRRQRFSMGGDELSGEAAGGGHAYLLTQNCSHGELKTIPSAGSAQAGPLRYEAAPGAGRGTGARRWFRCRRRDRTGGARG